MCMMIESIQKGRLQHRFNYLDLDKVNICLRDKYRLNWYFVFKRVILGAGFGVRINPPKLSLTIQNSTPL